MKYQILMMDCNEDNLYYIFTRYSDLQKHGLKVEIDRYNVVYEGEIPIYNGDISVALERLYQTFNLYHPSDYEGRSLSVSDIIKIDDEYYYVDSLGFKHISERSI